MNEISNISLGIKEGCPLPTDSGQMERKVAYPELRLRDGQVDALKGRHQCVVGDEYDATLRLRVSGQSDDRYGKSLTFEVLEAGGLKPVASQDVDEEDEEPGEEEKPMPRAVKRVKAGYQ